MNDGPNLPIPTSTVAAYCGVGEQVIYTAAKENLIPFTKTKGGSNYIFHTHDLETIKQTLDRRREEARERSAAAWRTNAELRDRMDQLTETVGKHRTRLDLHEESLGRQARRLQGIEKAIGADPPGNATTIVDRMEGAERAIASLQAGRGVQRLSAPRPLDAPDLHGKVAKLLEDFEAYKRETDTVIDGMKLHAGRQNTMIHNLEKDLGKARAELTDLRAALGGPG